MARIRNVKPEFFRHEGLQDLEKKHPRIMLFFAGLWCQCDKAGRFRWMPNQIKLDVMPFIKYDPSTYLDVLWKSDYLFCYEVDEGKYGQIHNFKKHQVIWGSELKANERWPSPPLDVLGTYVGRTLDCGDRNNGDRNKEEGSTPLPPKGGREKFQPPALDEVSAYCRERGNGIDAEAFIAFYASKGWKVGSTPMKDWRAAVVTWEKRKEREPVSAGKAETRGQSWRRGEYDENLTL